MTPRSYELTTWTVPDETLLREQWAAGKTAGEICELMHRRHSRNAIIGKAHRLGLAARPSPITVSVKRLTPSVRVIYTHLEEMMKVHEEVTPADLAKKAGWSHSSEIFPWLDVLYKGGYVGKRKEGIKTYIKILQPLPPQDPKTRLR